MKTAMFVLATALIAGCGGKSGPGGATVLAKGRTGDGQPCREVLIETTVEGLPTDWRTRMLCRTGGRWREVAAER